MKIAATNHAAILEAITHGRAIKIAPASLRVLNQTIELRCERCGGESNIPLSSLQARQLEIGAFIVAHQHGANA